MVSVGKIICKTIGVAGMGLALFDATQASKSVSRRTSMSRQADYLEKSYYNARTIDNISTTSNNVRAKTFDLETWNPLPAFFGKIGGGIKGFMYSLAVNMPLVLASSFAIASKGFMSKVGAISVGLGAVYKIAREGFGLGKEHPMS